jgi:hypothetical protein
LSEEQPDQIKLLKEILKWTKFAGMQGVKDALISTLNTDEKKLVYQLSDGTSTNAQINKLTGVSAGSISSYWKKWSKLGLGEKTSVMGGDRFVRSFDLEDFEISFPKIKSEQPKQEPKDPQKQ